MTTITTSSHVSLGGIVIVLASVGDEVRIAGRRCLIGWWGPIGRTLRLSARAEPAQLVICGEISKLRSLITAFAIECLASKSTALVRVATLI